MERCSKSLLKITVYSRTEQEGSCARDEKHFKSPSRQSRKSCTGCQRAAASR